MGNTAATTTRDVVIRAGTLVGIAAVVEAMITEKYQKNEQLGLMQL